MISKVGTLIKQSSITFVVTIALSQAQAFQQNPSTCDDQARLHLMQMSDRYIRFLCDHMGLVSARKCYRTVRENQIQSLACVNPNGTVQELRNQALAFMQDPEMRKLVYNHYLEVGEGRKTRHEIFEKFNVLIFPGGIQSEVGPTLNWSEKDLDILSDGFHQIYRAIENKLKKSGKSIQVDELSHLWGRGGAIARRADIEPAKMQSGQFGLHMSNNPMEFSVVAPLSRAGFTGQRVAQQMAHENGHASDYIKGGVIGGLNASWTENSDAKIYRMCGISNPTYATSLDNCFKRRPDWFSFHLRKNKSFNYAAKNGAEFYTKMLDHWVREGLGIVNDGGYRCQNPQTEEIWFQMESQFLGSRISTPCSGPR